MGKVLRLLFRQSAIVSLLLVLQAVCLVLVVVSLDAGSFTVYGLCIGLSLLVALLVVNKPGRPSYKLAWVIPILVFPVFGGLFYLLVTGQRRKRHLSRRVQEAVARSLPYLPRNLLLERRIVARTPALGGLLHYLRTTTGYAPCAPGAVQYLPLGEHQWAEMLDRLARAERYIFLEYFIIKDGAFWRSVRDVLVQKAAEGVDVRVIYDGIGCLNLLPRNYPAQLEKLGIRCKVFNPFVPFLTVVQNNRDHRKLCIIDGTVAICGGINLGDEYVNLTRPLGHWKDTAVLLQGDAAWAMTVLFLQMWDTLSPEERLDYAAFAPPGLCAALPDLAHEKSTDPDQSPDPAAPGGFVLPFSDQPTDGDDVSEALFLHIIHHARRHLHIMTPYLILDQGLVSALIHAAKRGVDVKIIVPGRSDHWYAHAVARAYYAELSRGGVQIYRYLPGFLHAKSICWDDVGALVGTVNFDYRSLYLQFECGVWMQHVPAVADVARDFAHTLARASLLRSEQWTVRNPILRFAYALLRVFAPLM